ncbi:WD40 domain-containing protein, partial [Cephalotus follicularis]
KVKQNKKRCMELAALYTRQDIQAHKGIIWAMKFSSSGRYLASGGEDGVVRSWRATSTDVACESFMAEDGLARNVKKSKSSFGRKKSFYASVMFPERVFQIVESPLHECHGHSNDILDLAWSSYNCLLSSSKDKTVRLWQVGCDQCLISISCFSFVMYITVTCIQFNPVDDNNFISGSIDGKVRIWGVSEKRVVDWADVPDVIYAVSCQPNGEGFIVGTITGICRFYEASVSDLKLEAELHIQGKKKTFGKKITGIFSQEISQRVMITSENSKIRIFDGVDVVHKFKGFPKSGGQISASFTSTGRHIISVGEDCRIYVWNYNGLCNPSSKNNSMRACEHFLAEGVSIAVPWSGMGTEYRSLTSNNLRSHMQIQDHYVGGPWTTDSECFSLGNWFSIDGPCRASSTWPEEKLPLWDITTAEGEYNDQYHQNHQQQQQHQHNDCLNHTSLSKSRRLVIVTAGWDGTIRTFHNYGLPVRL